MSTGAAIAVAVSVASDVRGRVDERGYLKLVPMSIRDVREGLGKVNMLAADIDSRGGFSAEFVRVSVCIIGGKFDLMDMRFAFSDCLTGNRGGLPFSGIICFILYLMKKGKFGAN